MNLRLLDSFKRNRFLRYGLPFLVLIVGGSFGLREFSSLRYQFRKNEVISPEVVAKLGIKMKRPGEVTLESEFEKMQQLDIDNWENRRVPRPWESTTTTTG